MINTTENDGRYDTLLVGKPGSVENANSSNKINALLILDKMMANVPSHPVTDKVIATLRDKPIDFFADCHNRDSVVKLIKSVKTEMGV